MATTWMVSGQLSWLGWIMSDYYDAAYEEEDVVVSMPNQQIMERWIARRVLYENEVCVEKSTGEVIKGFVTGLDSGVIQISTSSDGKPRSILISRNQIVSYESTGKKLLHFDREFADKIRGFAFALKQVAEDELKSQKKRKDGHPVDPDGRNVSIVS